MFSKILCDFLETIDDPTLIELDQALLDVSEEKERHRILRSILIEKYPPLTDFIRQHTRIEEEVEHQKLELFPYQQQHVDQLADILEENPVALDTSPLGSGKTFTSLALAQLFDFPILVIGPKTLEPVWRELSEEYGIQLIDYLSYQKLRSKKGLTLRHPYLTREDSKGITTFEPTPYWTDLVQRGILLVVDEVQMIKNKTDQYDAVRVLASNINQNPENSRVLLLSGTPFDKQENAINLLRLLGFAQKPGLRDIQEVIMKAREIDPKTLGEISRAYPQLNGRNGNSFVYDLFRLIIEPTIRSQMANPTISAEKDVKNLYARVTPEEREFLMSALEDLQNAATYSGIDEDLDEEDQKRPPGFYAELSRALTRLESAKIGILERQARKVLDADPNSKVIIYVNYIRTIELLQERLAKYNPVLLYGKMSGPERSESIHKFQNDPRTRLLIGNIKVGGVGLSLHDKDGRYPRTLFVVPNFSVLDLHQATGRIYRQGTRSKATVRFVYGDVGINETRILDALARKSAILHEILEGQILLPGDYDNEYDE